MANNRKKMPDRSEITALRKELINKPETARFDPEEVKILEIAHDKPWYIDFALEATQNVLKIIRDDYERTNQFLANHLSTTYFPTLQHFSRVISGERPATAAQIIEFRRAFGCNLNALADHRPYFGFRLLSNAGLLDYLENIVATLKKTAPTFSRPIDYTETANTRIYLTYEDYRQKFDLSPRDLLANLYDGAFQNERMLIQCLKGKRKQMPSGLQLFELRHVFDCDLNALADGEEELTLDRLTHSELLARLELVEGEIFRRLSTGKWQ